MSPTTSDYTYDDLYKTQTTTDITFDIRMFFDCVPHEELLINYQTLASLVHYYGFFSKSTEPAEVNLDLLMVYTACYITGIKMQLQHLLRHSVTITTLMNLNQ